MRQHLTYANVMATVAVFIALGGTSYALTLPRNSVGASQIRENAVGASELRRGAVTEHGDQGSRATRPRSHPRSPSVAARSRGPRAAWARWEPRASTIFATIDSAGARLRGNATSSEQADIGGMIVGFAQPVGSCVATATLTPPAPPLGHITTEPSSDGRVLVRTWDASGTPVALPFNLIVAC